MPITRDSIKKYLRSEYPHVTITNNTLLTFLVPAHIQRFVFSRFMTNLLGGMKATMDPVLLEALKKTKFETLGDILPFLLCMQQSVLEPKTSRTTQSKNTNNWVYTPQRNWPFPTGLKD